MSSWSSERIPHVAGSSETYHASEWRALVTRYTLSGEGDCGATQERRPRQGDRQPEPSTLDPSATTNAGLRPLHVIEPASVSGRLTAALACAEGALGVRLKNREGVVSKPLGGKIRVDAICHVASLLFWGTRFTSIA
jgi:hypothetical protein